MPTISAAAHDIQYSGPVDEVAAALAFHDGDVRATIGTLIEDCRHLREQLALTQAAMSIGFTRGWTPCFEREALDTGTAETSEKLAFADKD